MPCVSQDELLTTLYEQVNPGVVSILVFERQGIGQGTGFVYDEQGHIITNLHVVASAAEIEVHFTGGDKLPGKVIGTDSDSDIAVIAVEGQSSLFHPLPLGDGESLRVGQTVVAIGNPFGLSGTMTTGIISAKGRTLDSLRESPDGGVFSSGAVIQTDAAINPGNSGGPLLNLAGEVVGINRAIRTNTSATGGEPLNSGIGFAVNIDVVKRVVPALIETGKYDYPYLGISSLNEISLKEQLQLKLTQSMGAYVTSVVTGSPADKAGLIAGNTRVGGDGSGGDLIIAVDGNPVRVFGDLLTYLMTQCSPGDEIILTIIRKGQTIDVPLTLGSRP